MCLTWNAKYFIQYEISNQAKQNLVLDMKLSQKNKKYPLCTNIYQKLYFCFNIYTAEFLKM